MAYLRSQLGAFSPHSEQILFIVFGFCLVCSAYTTMYIFAIWPDLNKSLQHPKDFSFNVRVFFRRQLHAAHFQMRCPAAAEAGQKCLLLPLEHGRMLPLLPLQFFVRRRPSFLSVFSSYKHWRCGLLPFQVIAAEGEQKASRALREASEVISESSSALQLRYLQVLLTYLLASSLFFFLEATR